MKYLTTILYKRTYELTFIFVYYVLFSNIFILQANCKMYILYCHTFAFKIMLLFTLGAF
jgi:hypothetical protein